MLIWIMCFEYGAEIKFQNHSDFTLGTTWQLIK